MPDLSPAPEDRAACSPLPLGSLVRREITQPVDNQIAAIAAAIAARHGRAARAVLFYGSCLRERHLDGMMLDFYVIVSSYRGAYGAGWQAFANRLVPPNVYAFQHEGLSAKYAVLSETDFRRACGPAASDVSVWARFAQPSRLVWARDEAAREAAVESIARAAPTLFGFALPMLSAGEGGDPLAVWKRGFALTYACELRVERPGRGVTIVAGEPDRYRTFTSAVFAADFTRLTPKRAATAWRGFRRVGKLKNVARLLKASTTFAGGADYLVWKINRHAGTRIELKPWQRRWPLIGAITLLPRLLRQVAIR